MMSSTSNLLRLAPQILRIGSQRNLATTFVAAQKVATDPIQGLFVEKIRDYATKKKASGGKFVDATPEVQAEIQNDLDKVAKVYGGGKGVDMTKFPDFKWQEPAIEVPDLK